MYLPVYSVCLLFFCLSTWDIVLEAKVRIIHNAHVRLMEAENSIILTIYIYSSENIFIALGWHSEMIMGFHEYT